jgi:predicted transcriptional regulator
MYLKLACHGLFMAGLSMREIAKLVGVTAQSVSRWIKKWHPAYMSELGEKSVLYRATSQNLADCLELSDKDELLVSSNILPSGTQYSIVIRLPRLKEKSLEK